MTDYPRVNLGAVEDMAAKHGFSEHQEARFHARTSASRRAPWGTWP